MTGLRGVGKTVLLLEVKPIAMQMGWLWCGEDMSESVSVTEDKLAVRILTDLSLVTSVIPLKRPSREVGFSKPTSAEWRLNYEELLRLYNGSPGLVSDKLKATLEKAWGVLKSQTQLRGIVFAYDEVQTMQDHASKEQFPLSLLLDVFQSLQRRGVPFLLILTGLPTLPSKLVSTRTYSERMFETVFLEQLSDEESREAIERPLEKFPIKLSPESVVTIIRVSDGYPYFIQFLCREVLDIFIQQDEAGTTPSVPVEELLRKLDTDFFAGRWGYLSDRQRELLQVVANLNDSDGEFTVQEIQHTSKKLLKKPFGGSQITQMLNDLSERGIVYRNRHGKYRFAVPLFGEFIKRQGR
jgi:hypothetical protein